MALVAEWRRRSCPECGVGPGEYCTIYETGRITLTPHERRRIKPTPATPNRIVLGEGYPEAATTLDKPRQLAFGLVEDHGGYAKFYGERVEEFARKRVRLVLEVIE